MEFKYDGQNYQVNISANDICSKEYFIQLPDKRFLKVVAWLESYPPEPHIIDEVPDEDVNATDLVAIAFSAN